jgi:hypothetical protein
MSSKTPERAGEHQVTTRLTRDPEVNARVQRGLKITLVSLAAGVLGFATTVASAQDPLPSWNDGPAKQAILEYAYGPAQGLPDTKVGTFTQALYDEATKNGWIVISMKNDWKVIFPFESKL